MSLEFLLLNKGLGLSLSFAVMAGIERHFETSAHVENVLGMKYKELPHASKASHQGKPVRLPNTATQRGRQPSTAGSQARQATAKKPLTKYLHHFIDLIRLPLIITLLHLLPSLFDVTFSTLSQFDVHYVE